MRTYIRAIASLALGTSLFWGCSEANDDLDGGSVPAGDAGHDGTTGSGTGTGAGKDAGTSSQDDAHTTTHADSTTPPSGDSGVLPPPPADAGLGGVVINELCGKTQDFVELFNTGSASVSLANWSVTEAKDTDAGTMGSDRKTPVVFPSGTMLGAGEYVVVWGAPSSDGATVPACPSGAQCFPATWNISNKSGATAYLLNPAGGLAAEASYPGGSMVGTAQSWGRLPNGTGTFQINTATPGAANQGP